MLRTFDLIGGIKATDAIAYRPESPYMIRSIKKTKGETGLASLGTASLPEAEIESDSYKS